jgi:hypothetical protein
MKVDLFPASRERTGAPTQLTVLSRDNISHWSGDQWLRLAASSFGLNNVFLIVDCTASSNRTTGNDLEGNDRSLIDLLFRHLPGWTEENQEQYSVLRLRVEPSTSRIWVNSVIVKANSSVSWCLLCNWRTVPHTQEYIYAILLYKTHHRCTFD